MEGEWEGIGGLFEEKVIFFEKSCRKICRNEKLSLPLQCKNEKEWRFRLAARTHASHAWNTGSIPVVATNRKGKL